MASTRTYTKTEMRAGTFLRRIALLDRPSFPWNFSENKLWSEVFILNELFWNYQESEELIKKVFCKKSLLGLKPIDQKKKGRSKEERIVWYWWISNEHWGSTGQATKVWWPINNFLLTWTCSHIYLLCFLQMQMSLGFEEWKTINLWFYNKSTNDQNQKMCIDIIILAEVKW